MKIVDVSILFFSLKILSRSFLHFVGIRVFIVGCMRNVKSQFQPNRAFWQLNLTTGTSCEFKSQANCLARLEVLSYLHASHVCHSSELLVASQSRDLVSRLFLSAHILSFLHTLSHTTLT